MEHADTFSTVAGVLEALAPIIPFCLVVGYVAVWWVVRAVSGDDETARPAAAVEPSRPVSPKAEPPRPVSPKAEPVAPASLKVEPVAHASPKVEPPRPVSPKVQAAAHRPALVVTDPPVATSSGWNLFSANEELMEGPAPRQLELFGTVIVRKGEMITRQELERRVAELDRLPNLRPAPARPAQTPHQPPCAQARPSEQEEEMPGPDEIVREGLIAARAAFARRGIELEIKEALAGGRRRPYATAIMDIAEGSRFLWIRGLAESQALAFVLNLGFGDDSEEARTLLEETQETSADADESLLHAAIEDEMLAVRAMLFLEEPWTEQSILDLFDRMAELCESIVDLLDPAPDDSPAVTNFNPDEVRPSPAEPRAGELSGGAPDPAPILNTTWSHGPVGKVS